MSSWKRARGSPMLSLIKPGPLRRTGFPPPGGAPPDLIRLHFQAGVVSLHFRPQYQPCTAVAGRTHRFASRTPLRARGGRS